MKIYFIILFISFFIFNGNLEAKFKDKDIAWHKRDAKKIEKKEKFFDRKEINWRKKDLKWLEEE